MLMIKWKLRLNQFLEYSYYLADSFLVTSISDCIILEHPLKACCVLSIRIISSVISVFDFSKKPA